METMRGFVFAGGGGVDIVKFLSSGRENGTKNRSKKRGEKFIIIIISGRESDR